MLYGASYYPEYQPIARLEEDLLLMQAAGINFLRLGDSIWSLAEPEDGRVNLDWLQETLDRLHRAGISAALVTPTYAIPPWLARKHPEIMATYRNGKHAWFGARQNMDFTHPAYLFHAERIIRAVVSRYASHPAVIGFQVDNETGVAPLYNPNVIARFIDHLKETFGTLDRVNEVYGLNYWSHRLHDWSDVWSADGNTNPGYNLEWRRFQSKLTTDFLAWQVGIVREYTRLDQWITHDCVGGHGLPIADRYEIGRIIDVASENPYHPTQEGLSIPPPEKREAGPEWIREVGAWSIYFKGDIGRSAQQRNYFVTELNALSVGGASANYPAYDGQWRQVALTHISRGANAIAYWHWNTLHYGAETYWGGMLPHDYSQNRVFRELTLLGKDLECHGDRLTDLQVDSEVGLLYSQDSKYALEFNPCLTVPGDVEPDPYSYQRIFNSCYRSCFDSNAQTSIVHPNQDFEQLQLLVVPALYVADDGLLHRIAQYVQDGGHLLLTFRSGYADEFGRARWDTAPGPLRRASGISYREYSNLNSSLSLRAGAGCLGLPPESSCDGWADGLELEGATPLAYYDHPHFGRWPAITTHAFGQGRVTYLGTLPNPQLGRAVVSWAMHQANIQPRVSNLPEAVRVTTARNRQGERLWFIANWSQEPQRIVDFPISFRDMLNETTHQAHDALTLQPWDMRVLIEDCIENSR